MAMDCNRFGARHTAAILACESESSSGSECSLAICEFAPSVICIERLLVEPLVEPIEPLTERLNRVCSVESVTNAPHQSRAACSDSQEPELLLELCFRARIKVG